MMRFLCALFYAMAIGAGAGALLNTLCVGGLVFVGTLCLLAAVEQIVRGVRR